MHCSQLTCQQLQAEQKKKMREMQNATVDVESKHIRSSGVILLLRTYQCSFHTYEFSFGFVHQGEVSKQKLLIFVIKEHLSAGC